MSDRRGVHLPPFLYPLHLCPICGGPAETTGGICGKHTSVTYDSKGNVLETMDWEGHHTVRRVWRTP